MQEAESTTAVYGSPPIELAEAPARAMQVSPLYPGAQVLEDVQAGSLAALVMAAPAGVLERRYQLALGMQALRPGARLSVLAPKDKGGARLRKELEGFGCLVEETARRHHRICTCARPDTLNGIVEAIRDGAPRFIPALSLWSQPGVFSWDRIDPGSSLLVRTLPQMAGRGADLGCGTGYLACAVLASAQVERLALIDIDRRSIEAARHNVDDPRAAFHWADATQADLTGASLSGLDFVVMNPPFHQEGAERRDLGLAFIRSAARMLRKDGRLWLVANRHLPYEAELTGLFARAEPRAEQDGYKVFEARR